MPKYLSRQQVEQYHEQSFLAPIDVMSEDEAGNYLQRLQAAENETIEHKRMIARVRPC